VRLDEAALVRAPQAYVFRIASNLVYELRHNKRRNPVTFDSCLADAVSQSTSDPRTMEPAEYLDVQQHINALLEQLPPLYAVIVVMKKRDGLSMEEIAHELGLSIHTVKKYLSKALAQIRAHLTH
jgi:RNA polymerase sigma-70 factor (ECF subfamily)